MTDNSVINDIDGDDEQPMEHDNNQNQTMPFMFKQRAPQYSIPFLQNRSKFTRSEL